MSCILDALQIRAAGVSKDYDSVGVSVSILGLGPGMPNELSWNVVHQGFSLTSRSKSAVLHGCSARRNGSHQPQAESMADSSSASM